MPFPPQQVFVDYLNLYRKIRAEDRNSWSTAIKSGLESVASSVTGKDPVVKQIEGLITTSQSQIMSAKDFHDWYTLIFDLRKRAEICQELKRASGESLACAIFHGLASLILQQLERDPDYKQQLDNIINSQIAEIKQLEYESEKALNEKRGQNVDQHDKKIGELIAVLAQLGQLRFIREAKNRGMFNYLPERDNATIINFTKNAGNKVGFLELQTDFAQWLFCNRFQPTVCVSYDEFLQAAADNYYKREKEREAMEKKSRDAALASQQSGDTVQSASPSAADAAAVTSILSSHSSSASATPRVAASNPTLFSTKSISKNTADEKNVIAVDADSSPKQMKQKRPA